MFDEWMAVFQHFDVPARDQERAVPAPTKHFLDCLDERKADSVRMFNDDQCATTILTFYMHISTVDESNIPPGSNNVRNSFDAARSYRESITGGVSTTTANAAVAEGKNNVVPEKKDEPLDLQKIAKESQKLKASHGSPVS